ncbi:MAG: alkaline phosphatase family protein, partial [Actinomycetota bacterium]|nr:alkaline phosphatase family protein [Actinomycetota bacterium]
MTPPGVVLPAYGRGSLAEVVPAAAAALGAGLRGSDDVLPLPATRRCVVLLVDGLGERLLLDHADDAPYLCALPHRVITAPVPSTTATSLTSLGTALAPGQHGVVGFTSRIPGTSRLLNALRWDSRVDPADWQPHPTAFGTLAAAGTATTVVSKRAFLGSGLTLASQR